MSSTLQVSAAPSRIVPANPLYVRLYVAALICGIILRLIYPREVAWDPDQHWNFETAVSMGRTQPWDWIGMTSSGGPRNPGLSAWIFVFLAQGLKLNTPELLARGIAVMSILSLILLGGWALRQMHGRDRELWLAGTALAAVNPIVIFLDRVIWAQSTLPLITVAMWIGLWNRDRRWGAFLGCMV